MGALGNTHDSTYFQSTDLWDRTEAGISTIEEAGRKWQLNQSLADLKADSEYFIRNVKVTRKP